MNSFLYSAMQTVTKSLLIIAYLSLSGFVNIVSSQNTQIHTFTFDNTSLDEALIQISEETEIDLIFNPEITRGKYVSGTYSGVSPVIILQQILLPLDLRYQRLPNDIFAIRHSLSRLNPVSVADYPPAPKTLYFQVSPDFAQPVFRKGKIISHRDSLYEVAFDPKISRYVIYADGFIPKEIAVDSLTDTTHVELHRLPGSIQQRFLDGLNSTPEN